MFTVRLKFDETRDPSVLPSLREDVVTSKDANPPVRPRAGDGQRRPFSGTVQPRVGLRSVHGISPPQPARHSRGGLSFAQSNGMLLADTC